MPTRLLLLALFCITIRLSISPVEASTVRVGGDTIEAALEIPYLPYSDTGNTCGYGNDYDAVCPYSGSTAPDVVYKLDPLGSERVLGVDLCASSYDTKIYVYEAPNFSEPIACNDDASCGYSGYQSSIDQLCVYAGSTYYIVIDGYGNGCGDYEFSIVEYAPCFVGCPPSAVQENEPECQDGYVDVYNAGCSSDPPVFQSLEAQSQGCVDVCGRSCAYTTNDELEYDEDWYEITALGGASNPIAIEFLSDAAGIVTILAGTCEDVTTIDSRQLGPCEPGSFSFDGLPGERFMLGYSATEHGGGCEPGGAYWLHVCGIEAGSTSNLPLPPDPNFHRSSWGKIKARYRD